MDRIAEKISLYSDKDLLSFKQAFDNKLKTDPTDSSVIIELGKILSSEISKRCKKRCKYYNTINCHYNNIRRKIKCHGQNI